VSRVEVVFGMIYQSPGVSACVLQRFVGQHFSGPLTKKMHAGSANYRNDQQTLSEDFEKSL
jgi:hypothetical protein